MAKQDNNSFREPSMGTMLIYADKQIKRGIADGSVELEKIEDSKYVVIDRLSGEWFVWEDEPELDTYTILLGAVCGDIAGSLYEHHNIKTKLPMEYLIDTFSDFTDDSVLTCAVAYGIMKGMKKVPKNWLGEKQNEEILFDEIKKAVYTFGNLYSVGYGGNFRKWLKEKNPEPYNSMGNGSAMRVSYAGWIAKTLEEAEKLGELSARITHNHPEGIKGAQAIAGGIYVLRTSGNKEMFKEYVSQYYDIDFSIDDIRDTYVFDVTCPGSVPQAIASFLEGKDYADVIANAISIGGDSDTIAAIAGSLAETIYPMPQLLRGKTVDKLDGYLKTVIVECVDYFVERNREKDN